MSMLHVLGFTCGACGCLMARYRNLVTNRESTCVEAPAAGCFHHRRGELLE